LAFRCRRRPRKEKKKTHSTATTPFPRVTTTTNNNNNQNNHSALFAVLSSLPEEARAPAVSIAIDGTSATALLVDVSGSGKNGENARDDGGSGGGGGGPADRAKGARVLAPPRLYNEAQPARAVRAAAALAGADHTAAAATSTLAKLLDWWGEDGEGGGGGAEGGGGSGGEAAAAAARQGSGGGGGNPARRPGARLLHQADWLASLLHGRTDTTDWNNALKVGFDPGEAVLPTTGNDGVGDDDPSAAGSGGRAGGGRAGDAAGPSPASPYPRWLAAHPGAAHLLPPRVVPPGAPVGRVTAAAARRSGLPEGAVVCAGTTDSIAAFIAATAGPAGSGGGGNGGGGGGGGGGCGGGNSSSAGLAVTSLGSTIAVKLLSPRRVDDAASGVYSHRLASGAWLVGGASNAGGAALRAFFPDDAEIAALEPSLPADPRAPPPRGTEDWYPLLKKGERFPVYDPGLEPRLPPPFPEGGRAALLHGLLAALTRVEGAAYRRLGELGAAPPREVRTAGGGARNARWLAMRRAALGVPVVAADEAEASYGAALLARDGSRAAQRAGAGWEAAAEEAAEAGGAKR